ncbi:restriction endonuclease-like protein [Vibrio fluvialis]|nr:DUF2357 domain-containing protein [Vibrio sp. bablab_jr001]EKO3401267.1 DUF2357 domain-containing protein [Vibrio fluvialis]MBY8118123.1 restriction endonuclease-like protein [Vibrio fluvialis]MBY8250637.1 restriction endonuclease-like protein [Vibrio fluvialis]MBY8284205.1 restriction endonuclease-like protein [Vibrio fluvialis]
MIKYIDLIDSNSKDIIRIWPNKPDDIQPELYENKTYQVEVGYTRETKVTSLHIDDSEMLALRPRSPNTDLWQWETGFIAGSIDFDLYENNKLLFNKNLVLSPSRNKLTHSEFEIMLSQILQESSELFSLGESRVSVEEGIDYSTPLTKLEHLRSNFNAIYHCISSITDNPVSYLRNKVEYQDPSKLSGVVDPTKITEAHSIHGSMRFRKTFIPTKLPVTVSHSELDIYEHRCIKHCLNVWSVWLLFIGRKIKRRSERSKDNKTLLKWAQRAFKLSASIEELLRKDFFNNVSDLGSLLIQPTNIFTSIPQYRKFFDLQRKVNMGIGKSFGDFLNMPLAKTHKLYEIWCYYRLISACKILGYAPTSYSIRKNSTPLAKTNVIVEVGFDTFSLHFQKSYDEYWKASDDIGSYSRTMIPDISLRCSDSNKSIVVLDAKYRVEKALNDAIASSHMYRDAIVSDNGGSIERKVVGAYLISPSVNSAPSSNWEKESSPKIFFNPAYVNKFKFGVISLNPRAKIDELANVMKNIIPTS